MLKNKNLTELRKEYESLKIQYSIYLNTRSLEGTILIQSKTKDKCF